MDSEKTIIKAFVDGGWVIPVIGAAAMVARLLSSKNKLSIAEQFKKIFVASLSSSVAWVIIDSGAILQSGDINSLYKAIIYGIIGVISPELIGGFVNLGKKFEKSPEEFIKKN
jgi:hypothetical protein